MFATLFTVIQQNLSTDSCGKYNLQIFEIEKNVIHIQLWYIALSFREYLIIVNAKYIQKLHSNSNCIEIRS